MKQKEIQYKKILNELQLNEFVKSTKMRMLACRYGARIAEIKKGDYGGIKYHIESIYHPVKGWGYRLLQ